RALEDLDQQLGLPAEGDRDSRCHRVPRRDGVQLRHRDGRHAARARHPGRPPEPPLPGRAGLVLQPGREERRHRGLVHGRRAGERGALSPGLTRRSMRVVDPASAKTLAEVAEADDRAVADGCERARLAQPAWASTPLPVRGEAVRRFRALVVERTEALARTLTQEVGKPITQSRSELAGLLGRIDFFLDEVEQAARDQVVLTSAADRLEERIRWEPLGVVANISAWNYPWYVGGNVFLPALLT